MIMQRWEYCHIDASGDKKVARFIDGGTTREEIVPKGIAETLVYIAALGAQGWEMAGVDVRVYTAHAGEPANAKFTSSYAIHWFKRPVE
jgi:hypothetical protein